MGGCWVSVWCGCEVWELERWSDYLEGCGGSPGVVEYLRRTLDVVSGSASSQIEIERLRELEVRAAEGIERKRLEIGNMASDIVGRIFAGGDVDVGQVLGAAGMSGWRDGRERGLGGVGGNAGIQRNLTGRVVSKARRDKTRSGNDGSGGSVGHGRAALGGRVRSSPAKRPTTAADTRRKDREYAEKFEAWAAVQLCAMGLKMRHVARGVGLDVSTTWRYVSAYRRHTKRIGLEGRTMPPVSADWDMRLQECVGLATGRGVKGKPVVRSGVVKGAMERGEV